MKLETTARQLRSALRLIGHTIERRNTYPVLSCVLFDGATLRGTNLDMEIMVRLAATEARGRAAIDYHRLRSLVDLIDPDATIIVAAADKQPKDRPWWAEIAFPGGRYDLPVMDADSWPTLIGKGVEEVETTPIDGQALVDAVRFVAPSICNEETRYYLNGVCVSTDADGATCLVTTDGHKLSVAPLDLKAEWLRTKIVPKWAVKALMTMPAPDSVTRFSQEKIRFNWSSMTLTTKLIEGTFPDWQRVVPKLTDDAAGVTFRRAALGRALQRIQAVAGRRGACASLAFQNEAATITAIGADAQVREGLGDVATTNAEEPRVISFNATYMRSMLAVLGSDTARLSFNDDGAPMKLSAAGQKAWSILMPMRGDNAGFAFDALAQMSASEVRRAA